MRSMRLWVAAAALLVAVPVMAQGGPPGGGQGGPGGGMQGMQQRQNEILFKDINLTDAQKNKVDSIQTAARQAQMQLMQNGGMQDPAVREQVAKNREKMFADVRALLTPEQQTVFDKNRETLAQQMPGRGQGGPPPGRP